LTKKLMRPTTCGNSAAGILAERTHGVEHADAGASAKGQLPHRVAPAFLQVIGALR